MLVREVLDIGPGAADPAGFGEGGIFEDHIEGIFAAQTVLHHFELQLAHGTDDEIGPEGRTKQLGDALLG